MNSAHLRTIVAARTDDARRLAIDTLRLAERPENPVAHLERGDLFSRIIREMEHSR